MYLMRQEVVSKERFIKSIMAIQSQSKKAHREESDMDLYDAFMDHAIMDLEVNEVLIESKQEKAENKKEIEEIATEEIVAEVSEDSDAEELFYSESCDCSEFENTEINYEEELLEEIEDVLTEEQKLLIHSDLSIYEIDFSYVDELECYNDIKLTTKKIRGKQDLQIAFCIDELSLIHV